MTNMKTICIDSLVFSYRANECLSINCTLNNKNNLNKMIDHPLDPKKKKVDQKPMGHSPNNSHPNVPFTT